MSELIVDVTEVVDIHTHHGADRLEIAIIKGWQCIVPIDKFNVGDKVIYFPPDTILPQERTDEFGVTNYCQKKSEGMRIRQARLRGEPSFGLVVACPDDTWEIGKDVVEYYHAKKYEPPVLGQAGDVAGNDHPLFPRYTNIDNLQNYPTVLTEGEEVVATEKIHGCLRHDSEVMLANGEEIPISEILPDDMVLSFDVDNKSFCEKKVLNVIMQEVTDELDWYCLKFDNGRELICTEDHPVLTKNRGWTTAKELTENDEIISFY